jgi:hypothetical protein
MSIPTSVEAVVVIVLIFIPGYVFLQFTRSAVAFIPQTIDARYFFAVITWGGLIHALMLWWTLDLLRWYEHGTLVDEHPIAMALWGIITLVVLPLVCGVVGAALLLMAPVNSFLARIGLDYVNRMPSAWNYSTKLESGWVRVHLRDGTLIGGHFGPASFADDAGEKDIYLERVYNLNAVGDFEDEVVNTAGVWISHDVISHVMFYNVSANEEDQHGEDIQHHGKGGSEA